MAIIKIKRGVNNDLPILNFCELGYTTDTKKLFIGDGIGNVSLGPSDYGTQHSYNFDLSETSTNNKNWVSKLTHSIYIPHGIYKINYQFEYKQSKTGKWEGRCRIDNSVTIFEVEMVGKKWTLSGGFHICELTSGNHIIDIVYANSKGETSSIRNLFVECYRLS